MKLHLHLIAAFVLFAQTCYGQPQTVRSVENIAALVALKPSSVLQDGKGSVLVRGRVTSGDWPGDPRPAMYVTNAILSTNVDWVFDGAFGGQWIFPDLSNAIVVAYTPGSITSRWAHVFRQGLEVVTGESIVLGGVARSTWPTDADTLDGFDGAFYLNRANHTGTQPWSTLTGTPTTLAGYGITDPVWTALNDGPGSGMDADLLDGQHGAHYLDRANHTGTQAIATVSGLQGELDGKAPLVHEHDASDVTSGEFETPRLGTGTSDTDTALFGNAGGPAAWRQILSNDVGGLSAWMDLKADVVHEHDAADVTSGVFEPERLGTGTPNAGLILIANGASTDPYWGTAPTGPAGTNGIPDAPNDGSFYGRKSTSWVVPDISDIEGLSAWGLAWIDGTVTDDIDALAQLGLLLGDGSVTIDSPARHNTRINSSGGGTPRARLNLIAGTGISLSLTDDGSDQETEVTFRLSDRDWGDITSSSSGTVFNIDADAVGSSEIAANAVGSSEISDNAVGEYELADDAVVARKILNGSITTTKINDLAVTTDKLAASAVTYGKIQNVTPGKLLGGANDGVSSAPEEINVHSGLMMEGNNLMVDWSAAPAGDAPFAWVKFTSSIPDPCCDDEPVQAIISASGVSEVRRITVDGLYRLTLTAAQPVGDFKEVQTAYIAASADFRRAVVLSDGFYVSSGTTLYVYVDGGVPDAWKFMLRIFNR